MEKEDLEKYVKAVKTAIEEAPLKNGDAVDVTDLWAITSLPIDLITECIKSPEFKIPFRVSKLTNRGKMVVKNKNYLPKA